MELSFSTYYLAYCFPLGLACILGCGVACQAWMNWETTGARPLAGIALASVIWAGGSLGLTLATTPTVEFYWVQFEYLGIVGAPISFVILALEYAGYQQYLTLKIKGTLFAAGGLFLGLVWTNPLHSWYWAEINYTPATSTVGAAFSPAPGFWVFVTFTYVLLLVGTVLLVRYALIAPHLYRSQSVAILLGVGAPWAASIPYLFQWTAIDYTPLALVITTGVLWAAKFWYRLTDLGPVALRTVFESISAGVLVLDRHDRLVDVNDSGQSLLNISDNALGMPLSTFAPTVGFVEHVRSATDQPEVLVLDDSEQSGSEAHPPRYFEMHVTPIDTSHRRQKGRVVVVNDVTDRQRQQEQLERQNERLEAFTSVVSHDLRNPLNVATGSLALAQKDGNGEHLVRANRALSRMETLIDDLLSLAQGGNDATNPEPIPFAETVDDVWTTVDTKEATLRNRASLSIVADRSRLHQLIANLFRNSIEHGGRSVTVTIGNTENGFYVADDGPGFPLSKRGRLFETGYSTQEAGTGLGLNIVQKIADAHGWEVHAAKSAEGGALFEVTGVEIVT